MIVLCRLNQTHKYRMDSRELQQRWTFAVSNTFILRLMLQEFLV